MFKYTACDVADALVKLDINDGGFIPGLIRRSSTSDDSAIFGPAYTVLYALKDDPRPALTSHYIDSAPRDAVVVIGVTDELKSSGYTNALYGGLMSTRAKYLGCAGSVVLGRIRDIDEHRRLNYPVFSLDLGICAPNKVAKVVAVNCSVKSPSGGPEISAGDIIVGDENGVAVIPQGMLEHVLELIPPRVEADNLAAEDISKGIEASKAQKNRRQNL